MNLKASLYTVIIILTGLTFQQLLPGCANIIPPTGGPKDTLPPILVTVNPKDSTLNFTSKRVNFSFSEYVTLQDLTGNLIISPLPKTNPQIDAKLRTVTIRIKDTLGPNTTYTYDFGEAIRDINEGNIFRGFTYTFSTGTTIDSLELSGKVVIAETGGIDSTLIVMLHTKSDDSVVIKEKPRYIARVDTSGSYHFRNLPSDTFYLYALKDEGGTRRYLSKSQLFAFADEPVNTSEQNQADTLYAYVEKEEEIRTPASRTPPAGPKTADDKRLRFTTTLENNQLDLLDTLRITFLSSLKTLDTSRILFTDENFARIRNAAFLLDSARKVLTLEYNWPPDQAYHIILDKDFAEDSAGRKLLKTDTLDFRTKKEADYGTIRLEFPQIDTSNHPVLLLIQENKVVFTHVFTNKLFTSNRFKPGDYDLRILYDENQNGIWDPGTFFGKKKQPERVIPLQYRLNVRPAWEREDKVEF
jgi:hypothetical protein